MAVHKIELSQEALIGSFTKEAAPVLSVSPGDSIRFATLDAGWGTGRSNTDGFTAAGQYPNWQNQKLHLTECKEIILDWKLDNNATVGVCEVK